MLSRRQRCRCCEEGATGLQCGLVYDAGRVCLERAVLIVALMKSFLRAGATRIAVKTGLYLSRKRRMLLTLPVSRIFSCQQCLRFAIHGPSLHIGKHAYFTYSVKSTPLYFLPHKEQGNTRTHRTALLIFMMAKAAQTDTLSRSRSFLPLCQADTGEHRHSTDCLSRPRGARNRLRSPPWLSHVTSSVISKISSQQWPGFKAIFVNVLGVQTRGRKISDYLSANQEIATSGIAAHRWSASEKARALLHIATFVRTADTSSGITAHHREDHNTISAE